MKSWNEVFFESDNMVLPVSKLLVESEFITVDFNRELSPTEIDEVKSLLNAYTNGASLGKNPDGNHYFFVNRKYLNLIGSALHNAKSNYKTLTTTDTVD